jgi:Domain of unknown function (DUF4190)
MRVYCPNCGTDNEAQAGAAVTCRTCTATFTAPNAQGTVNPAPPPPPPPVRATPYPGSNDLGATAPPSSGGWVGGIGSAARPAPVVAAPASRNVPVNPLAIVSLVFGIVCCVPFFSPITALITGWLAIKQIDASSGLQRGRELAIAGLVLGVVGMGFWGLWLLGMITKS